MPLSSAIWEIRNDHLDDLHHNADKIFKWFRPTWKRAYSKMKWKSIVANQICSKSRTIRRLSFHYYAKMYRRVLLLFLECIFYIYIYIYIYIYTHTHTQCEKKDCMKNQIDIFHYRTSILRINYSTVNEI